MIYDLTGNGTHWPLCCLVRTECGVFACHEVPKVGWLATNTSVGTGHHTLGMSALSDDAAATSRLLSQVGITVYHSPSDIEVMPSTCYFFHFQHYAYLLSPLVPELFHDLPSK